MPYTTDSREFGELIKTYPKARKILAEGDSWFAYPRRFFIFGKDSNVVQCLAEKKDLVIYSTSECGDEALAMMSGEAKLSLMKRIKHTDFDLILFSGGGNDLVGRYDFGFFINTMEPGMTWQDCINRPRLERKLSQIRLVYEELIERAMDFSVNKAIRVVTHTYDIAIPDRKGFAVFDIFPMGRSWMYPYLRSAGISDPGDQQNIARFMLTEFASTLKSVETRFPHVFKVVDTQGTLTKQSQWRNEIHPTPQGFRLISEKIYSAM